MERVTLTTRQAVALEKAVVFYGSPGLLLHKHEERLAPYVGELEALNELNAKTIARSCYIGYKTEK